MDFFVDFSSVRQGAPPQCKPLRRFDREIFAAPLSTQFDDRCFRQVCRLKAQIPVRSQSNTGNPSSTRNTLRDWRPRTSNRLLCTRRSPQAKSLTISWLAADDLRQGDECGKMDSSSQRRRSGRDNIEQVPRERERESTIQVDE